MRRWSLAASAALVLLGAAGCNENVTSPPLRAPGGAPLEQASKGTGLTLNIVPTVTLPLGLGGSITINQAIVTHFSLLENTVGQIIGLEATGTLSGTAVNVLGGVIGVSADPFTADVTVTPNGSQCSLVTLDLSSLNINGLGLVTGTLPANVTVKGSGAVGSLLCNLGSALSGLTSGLTGSAQGLVNALNNQVGG